MVFRLEQYKWRAVVTEIKRMNKSGRPCLVGTTSVEKSEMLSSLLQAEGIKHQVCETVTRVMREIFNWWKRGICHSMHVSTIRVPLLMFISML